jgi:alkaline phosphatase
VRIRSLSTLLVSVVALAVFVVSDAPTAQGRARNVILFLADAGGIGTVNAASFHGYGAPRSLFIQRMPNIALSDTSPVGSFVTDSAAGMTAIVTGHKTRNGVISQSASAERKVRDGEPLKSILEFAEERGLSTGIITNDALTGATPAALYAKANDRGMTSIIFQQLFAPRFGNGPEIAIGAGRPNISKALAADGLDLDKLGQEKGRPVLSSLEEIPADAERAIVVLPNADYSVGAAIQTAIKTLSRNRRGYFLMVEWDTHTDNVRRGLDRMVALDKAIEATAAMVGNNTLIMFTADHSFDFRVRGGNSGNALLDGLDEAVAKAQAEKTGVIQTGAIRMQNSHTGEEVLVAAQGPGSQAVRGYLSNTDLFGIMMRAYGWK